jgi:transposase
VAAVKDDRFDAFVLADTLRHEHQHWRALAVPSPLLAEIRALPRDRDRLLETQQAIESQLRMILEAYHPAPVRLFSSIDRQITLHFVLDYPTPQTASRIKTTRMAGFLDRHHYTGRVSAQVLADRMRRHLLSASPGTVAGKSFSTQSFTRLLQLLNSQLADYEDAIAAAVAEHPDAPIFASFPGIGPVLTGGLSPRSVRTAPVSPLRRCCSPSLGSPRSPVPRAAPATSGSAMPPTPDCARPRCGGPITP